MCACRCYEVHTSSEALKMEAICSCAMYVLSSECITIYEYIVMHDVFQIVGLALQ
jgi:hypothetical protein